MKKTLLIITLSLLLLLTAGCSKNTTSNQDNFFWKISLINSEETKNLAATQTFQLYGGALEDVEYKISSTTGYKFLLLELTITKNGVGGNAFSWSDVYVEDEDGNKYKRHENDVFLEDYNIPRLKATDLTLGKNTGYVCFEVPENVKLSSLKLVHDSTDGKNIIAIH